MPRVDMTCIIETPTTTVTMSEPTAIRDLTDAELDEVVGGLGFSGIFFGGVTYPGGGGYSQVY